MAEGGVDKPRVALVTGITGQVSCLVGGKGNSFVRGGCVCFWFAYVRCFWQISSCTQDGSYLAELLLSKGYKVGYSLYLNTCARYDRAK